MADSYEFDNNIIRKGVQCLHGIGQRREKAFTEMAYAFLDSDVQKLMNCALHLTAQPNTELVALTEEYRRFLFDEWGQTMKEVTE